MRESISLRQVQVYLGKYQRIFLISKGWLNLISALIISTLIVAVTGENTFVTYEATRNGIFALVCACIWIGLFNSIQSICQERSAIKQEHRSGVQFSTFLLAHMIFDVLLSLVETLCMVLVVMVRYRQSFFLEGNFNLGLISQMTFSFFFIIYCADVLGLMLSTLVKTTKQAMTVMPFVLIIQLVVSGFIFKLKGIMEILSNLTLAKWGMAAISISLNVNQIPVDLEKPTMTSDIIKYTSVQLGETMKDAFRADYDPANFHWHKISLLILAFTLVEAIIAYLAMRRIDKDRR